MGRTIGDHMFDILLWLGLSGLVIVALWSKLAAR